MYVHAATSFLGGVESQQYIQIMGKGIDMPRGDGTGPMGMGSMTGRALGFCAGYPHPGFAAGQGRRMGRGFGHRNRFWALSQPPVAPTSGQQVDALRQQADLLRQSLQNIEAELERLRQDETPR